TDPILWGIPWKAEVKWLPFLTLVTVLVFWRAGLYSSRDARGGAGRILSSLLLVGVIVLAFAVGTGYQHTTFGLYPTAFVLCAVLISLLRASYEVVTRDVWRVMGVRRRAVLVGDGERLLDLRRALGRARGGRATSPARACRCSSCGRRCSQDSTGRSSARSTSSSARR